MTEPPARGAALRQRTIAALRVLDTCPLIPVDAFGPLVGLRRPGSSYQVLGRLRSAGLAEVRRVDLGYLLGHRRIGLWTTTEAGRKALRVHEEAVAGDATVPPVDGPPDGEMFILLHGFPEGAESWSRQLDSLAKAGFLVNYTFRPIEVLAVVAVMYFVLLYPMTLVAIYLQRRVMRYA